MDGMLRKSMRSGASFGLTSGVITTLGLMTGLHAGTESVAVVTGGILTIAIADALSDALGIHIAEESKNSYTSRQIWIATATTFSTKFFVSLTFLVPVLFLPLRTAVVASLLWGMAVICGLSYGIARVQGVAPWRVILEHLAIALIVVASTYAVGGWVARMFG